MAIQTKNNKNKMITRSFNLKKTRFFGKNSNPKAKSCIQKIGHTTQSDIAYPTKC